MLSWFAVEAGEQELQGRFLSGVPDVFGLGLFEQDDVENWLSITTVSQGALARRLTLNSRMGLLADDSMVGEPLRSFAGPGFARVGYGEFNQRNWLTLWSSHLSGGEIEAVHPLHGNNASRSGS